MWYEVVLDPDDNDTWMVTSPDFGEVATFGATPKDALHNARNAIEEAIAARISTGQDIPDPCSDPKNEGSFVQIPAMIFLKSALYMLLKEKGWSRADLMRALGCQREHVDRLFRLEHNSRLDSIEEAFEALGEPLRFDMPFHKAA